jgi:hypothetical protein
VLPGGFLLGGGGYNGGGEGGGEGGGGGLGGSNPLWENSFYVKADGDDDNAGDTEEAPFQTLSKALQAAGSSYSIKKITVIGPLDGTGETHGDTTSVFVCNKPGILISGANNGELRGTTGKRVMKVSATLRLEHITLTGADISSKSSQNGWGGGLYVEGYASVTLGEGAVISGNAAYYGGGASFGSANASLILAGGSIDGNTSTYRGGGVYVPDSRFTMTAGTIENNTANQENGGGISAWGTSTVELLGGSLAGNNVVTGAGDGVYVRWNGTCSLGGSVVIDGNNDLYLDAYSPTVFARAAITQPLTAPAAAVITLPSFTDALARQIITGTFTAADTGKLALADSAYWLDAAGKVNTGTPPGEGGGWPFTGDTYYVSGAGNDLNSGVQAYPFKTLGFAVQRAAATSVKKILVTGILSETTEYAASPRDSGSVFYIKDSGTEEIAITGTGGATLQGHEGKRVIMIEGASRVSFAGITVTGGKISGGNGGGIHITGGAQVELKSNAVVSGNSALLSFSPPYDGDEGGGVYVSGGVLVIAGKISGNNVGGTGGSYSYGGGVYAENSTVTLAAGGEITGNKLNSNNGGGGGMLVSGGSFTMLGGKINGNIGDGDDNTGVTFGGTTFEMWGGEIRGNATYGVRANGDAEFIMKGGTIADNGLDGKFWNYDGVRVEGYSGHESSFVMEGGVIEGNGNNGVLLLSGSDFTMSGGSIIRNNDALGVNIHNGVFTLVDGEISGNSLGVGIFNGDFEMKGGKIQDNIYSSSIGGDTSGVRFDGSGTFTMTDGVISGNTGGSVGGVLIAGGGTFTLMGSGEIKNNAGLSGSYGEFGGGGVAVRSGSFVMNGGKILNNSASVGGGVHVSGGNALMTAGEIKNNHAFDTMYGSSGCGGGVAVYGGGAFEIRGGTLSSNTAEQAGNGVFVYDGDSSGPVLKLGGAGVIHSSNDVGILSVTNYAGVLQYYGKMAVTSTLTGVSPVANITLALESVDGYHTISSNAAKFLNQQLVTGGSAADYAKLSLTNAGYRIDSSGYVRTNP